MFNLPPINFTMHGWHVVLAVGVTGVTVSLILLAITHFTKLKKKNLDVLIVPLLAALSQAGSLSDQVLVLHQKYPQFFNGTFAAVFTAAVLYHELIGNTLYKSIVGQLDDYEKTKADAAAYRAEQAKLSLQASVTPPAESHEFELPQ